MGLEDQREGRGRGRDEGEVHRCVVPAGERCWRGKEGNQSQPSGGRRGQCSSLDSGRSRRVRGWGEVTYGSTPRGLDARDVGTREEERGLSEREKSILKPLRPPRLLFALSSDNLTFLRF